MKTILVVLLMVVASPSSAQDMRLRPATSALKRVIQGIWWSIEPAPSAAFEISDSTIYYPEWFTGYPYHVFHDTLFVHRDDGISASRIVKATKDSLVLELYETRQLYVRTEPHRK